MAAIVHNTGTNYSLYYNVLNYFKTIMSNHPSIAAVGQGDAADLDTEQFPAYVVGNVNIIEARWGETVSNYQIELTIADKVKNKNNESEGVTNEQTISFFKVDDVVDIHANTLSILNDLTSYTQRSVEGFDIDGEIVCTPFSDRFNNGLAGWVAVFTLVTHNDRNRCLFELM
jgi:hypothetical protein